jgi:hypothetical protein
MKLSVIKFLVTLLYVLSVHINNAVFFKEQNIFKEQNTEQLCEEVRCMRNVGLIYLCILYGTYVDNKLYIIYNPYKSGSALRVQCIKMWIRRGLVNGGGGKRSFTLINRGGHKSFNTEKGGGGVKNVFELKYHV